jgi:hypothetical protein
MSTRFGYHCLTCHRSSEYWLNHGDAALQDVLDAWPTIIKPAFDFAAKSGWVEIEIYVMGVNRYGDETPLDFLGSHDGHAVVVESEYGQRLAPPASLGVSTEGASWAMEGKP